MLQDIPSDESSEEGLYNGKEEDDEEEEDTNIVNFDNEESETQSSGDEECADNVDND